MWPPFNDIHLNIYNWAFTSVVTFTSSTDVYMGTSTAAADGLYTYIHASYFLVLVLNVVVA